MNEVTTEQTDRFYKPLGDMCGSERREFEETLEAKVSLKPKKAGHLLEFAPEPLHMNEARAKGLKFVVGSKYPVLERKEDSEGYKSVYSFKTTDERGQEVWVDEKYFIPATVHLTYGDLFTKNEQNDDKLFWEDVVDIRKLAEEQNIQPLGVSICGSGAEYKVSSEDMNVLAGTKDSESEATFKTECKAWRHKKTAPAGHGVSDLYQGVVKDVGNELMLDANKCMAAISKVFGHDEAVDPDNIITTIRKVVPHLTLTWEDDVLAVNGAKTKIRHKDVQAAYTGLKALASTKSAEKTVGRLVGNKLKKLF